MRRLRLGDKVLRVRDEPEPPPSRGTPLVCIHGAGCTSVSFMDLVRRLPPARRVVAPDLPGHGQSDRWHDSITIDGYRDAVGTVCAHLGIQQAILCGHSMGAAVALRLALSYPERVAGLVLVAGAGALRVDRELFAVLERELPPGAETRADRMPPGVAALSFSPETPEELRARWQAVLVSASRDVVLGDFRACDGFDVREALPSLRLPVLCVGGADDLIVPPRLVADTAARIPGAQVQILDRAGHLPHLEQPDAFAALLEPFLRQIP